MLEYFYSKFFLKSASSLSKGIISFLSYKSTWCALGTITSSLQIEKSCFFTFQRMQ